MKHNYDTIAWFYDWLARLFFGRALINAQLFLINAIKANTSILIVGGGTGWILEEITKLHISGLCITYVDASAKMMDLSRKHQTGNNLVTFICAPMENAAIEGRFEAVLTPFFFDNFRDDTVGKITSFIDGHLSPEGLWLYCDFRNTDVAWQKILLRIMYLFFRVTCGIEAVRLPDVAACFSKLHYKVTRQKLFMNGFIAAEIYERM